MTDMTPIQDDATITINGLGVTGLSATFTNGPDTMVLGVAVMNADRHGFRWMLDGLSAYHGVSIVDNTNNATRKKPNLLLKDRITNVITQSLASMSRSTEGAMIPDDQQVAQLTALVMDALTSDLEAE